MKVVDAHLHFLDTRRFAYPWMAHPDHAALRHDYLPADFRRDVAASGVELVGTVHLQAEVNHATDPVLETAWLAELAATSSPALPTACVAYADLLAADVERVLQRHLRYPLLRGIRQEAWCDPHSDHVELLRTPIVGDPAFERGLRAVAAHDLAFDLLVFAHELDAAATLFRRLPELAVAVEHTGVPVPTREGLATWRRGLRRFADEVPRAVLKISAMGFVNARWTVEDIRPIVREAIEIFGPERCMFASNFPVERLASDYAGVWAAYDAVTADMTPAEREALFVGTATRFYRL